MLKKMLKRLKKSNAGFTLVELIVAIALFAIVVTPICNTFITSAKINRNARRVMIATDLAQNIFEGFSEKTFETTWDSLLAFQTTDLSGPTSFNGINGGVYNVSANWVDLSSSSALNTAFSGKLTTEHFNFGSGYTTQEIVSRNDVTYQMNNLVATEVVNKGLGGQRTYTYMFKAVDSTGAETRYDGGIFVVYTNIEAQNGYRYNAIVSILPTAENPSAVSTYSCTSNEFLSYNVKITLYDANTVSVGSPDPFGSPVFTMLGGIAGR